MIGECRKEKDEHSHFVNTIDSPLYGQEGIFYLSLMAITVGFIGLNGTPPFFVLCNGCWEVELEQMSRLCGCHSILSL